MRGLFEAARSRLVSLLSSYRLRLLGWFVVLLSLGTLATVIVVGAVLLEGTDERIRRDLLQESEEFAALVGGTDPATGEPFGTNVARIFDEYLDRNVPARNEVVLTFADGAFHRRSRGSPHLELQHEPEFVAHVATVPTPTTGRYASDAGAVDFLAVPVHVDGQPRGVFVVAAFSDLERAEQDDILRAVTTVGVMLLIIGSILAWRLADRVLAPVRRTIATARSITETDIRQRVEVRGHDEVAELSQTFNEMLDRISAGIDEQRRFMDDAGHELRTPLTIVRGHLELLDDANADERRRTLELVLDELDRMTRIVNDLVLLAATARPDFIRHQTLRVSELLATMHDKARVLGERDWQLEVGRDAELRADRQRLTQAVLQLAQNAVQQTKPGDLVAIGADADELDARFWVRDVGRGIAADKQAAIFGRFYRADTDDQTTGVHTGLGLSIVRAIAEAHGGGVTVASVAGGGATFTIVVPRDLRTRRLPSGTPRADP